MKMPVGDSHGFTVACAVELTRPSGRVIHAKKADHETEHWACCVPLVTVIVVVNDFVTLAKTRTAGPVPFCAMYNPGASVNVALAPFCYNSVGKSTSAPEEFKKTKLPLLYSTKPVALIVCVTLNE